MRCPKGHATARTPAARSERLRPQEDAAHAVGCGLSERDTATRRDGSADEARRARSAAPAGSDSAQTADLPGPSRSIGLVPGRSGASRAQLRALQRFAGNRAVAALVGQHTVQRVPLSTPNQTETLYNQTDASSGQATAKSYGGGPALTYDMTRSGDTAVTVTVRIKFLNQARNSVDPTSPGAPPGTPPLGAMLGTPTEIPANDPDNRRAWATDRAAQAVAIWNGRLALVEGPGGPTTPATPAPGGPPTTTPAAPAPAAPAPAGGSTPATPPAPPAPAPAPKRLSVNFAAVPVFGLNDPADSTVIIHPMATVAGTPGQPIDSGNWYQNKGTSYGNDDAVIAAHEYGHLIGIPDEYSQNSAQMNALMHQAAPGSSASARPPLDRPSIERMVLHAMRQPLYDQLGTVLGPVTTGMVARKERVRHALTTAARGGAADSSVTAKLTELLQAYSNRNVAPDVPQAVAFETTRNFSNATFATQAVDWAFDPATLSSTIQNAYWQALLGAEGAPVAVPGVGNVTIDVAKSVSNLTAPASAGTPAGPGTPATPATPAGPQLGTGAALATAAVSGPGAGATPAGAPGLPAIPPPPSLASQLAGLPATWDTAGSLLETGITPAAFAAKMVEGLTSAEAAAASAALVGRPVSNAASTGEMYQRAYRLTTRAALASAAQLASDLVGQTVGPTLQSSVSALTAAIDAEIDRISSSSPSAIAGMGTPNPNMTALVSTMKARFEADRAAADTNPGRDPMGASRSGAAPAQDVTYSYQGLMGSSTTRALRPDQFEPMVTNFNHNLLNPGESAFRAEVT